MNNLGILAEYFKINVFIKITILNSNLQEIL